MTVLTEREEVDRSCDEWEDHDLCREPVPSVFCEVRISSSRVDSLSPSSSSSWSFSESPSVVRHSISQPALDRGESNGLCAEGRGGVGRTGAARPEERACEGILCVEESLRMR